MLADLATAVRERKVSSVELVRMSLDRIDRLDPPINSVVAVRPEQALAEAAAVDARVAGGEDPGPLAGVPALIKDMEDVAGMATTFGSLVFEDAAPAARDGLIPRRLRAAGAVVVGKTNLPEFAFEGFTDNRLFGPTRNPWGLDWSPGGSSGGSGAAIAAGLVPIATATDGGGSIRIPAAFCGLAGLKPSAGVIGREPIPDWIDLSTFGPLATTIADLRLLLEIEAGPVLGDPTALPYPLHMRDEMPRRVLATPRWVDWGPLPEGIRASFDAALRSLEADLGLPVEPVDPGDIFRSGNLDDDWFTICAIEHAYLFGRGFIEANLKRFSDGIKEKMEAALSMPLEEYMAVRRRRFTYVRELDELLGEDTAFVMPTLGFEGWLADGRLPDTGEVPGSEGYNTNAQNICGHPGLSVPAGVSANGIPFGITFTGPRFRDDMVLTIGRAWEGANPWPAAAPGYEPFG